MSQKFNRITIDSDATNQLKMLKANTGMTPNYLGRIGFCYSLNEPRPPNPQQYDTDGQTFNRYTLLGEHDTLYMALLKERLIQEGKDPEEDLYEEFVAHLNRGVERVAGNVSDLSDFYDLVPGEIKGLEAKQEG
ncbi:MULTISPECIES: DNA sulfur modification protein DndE [Halobacteriales]|jgi:DNA sulfur modification protein DndE|uniref:DNA sulfur modification protein DndE n=1 Tax=Salarchaeum japonicum TaxID=555573 RepID=A0AAV3SYU8_9EURY|nr:MULTISPECIES: DNA sulfur modification protein DndE [Halobacteria]RLM83818.1 DNA sulfur modification protein DndE [Halobellus sp. Atlit-38R]